VSEKPENPQVVVTDEEIFEAHVVGKLSVELTAPLDTQRALSIGYTPASAVAAAAAEI
jgi:malate dehydrogenase (oxaloacetate-decarboxylating)